jgi:hypothetical protein
MRAAALLRRFHDYPAPADQFAFSVLIIPKPDIGAFRHGGNDAIDAQLSELLNHQIELLALQQGDGHGELQRRLSGDRRNLFIDMNISFESLEMSNFASKFPAEAIENVNLISGLQAENVPQMLTFICT